MVDKYYNYLLIVKLCTMSFALKDTSMLLHNDSLLHVSDRISFYYDNHEIGQWNANVDQAFLGGESDRIAPFNQEVSIFLQLVTEWCCNFRCNSIWKTFYPKKKLNSSSCS